MRKHHIRRFALAAPAGPITLLGAADSLSNSAPKDIRDGDFLLLCVQSSGLGTAGSFTKYFETDHGGSIDKSSVWYRFLQTRDRDFDSVSAFQGQYVWTWWRGVDPSSPFDTAYQTTTNSDDPPSITTVTNNAMVIPFYAAGGENNDLDYPGSPSGYNLAKTSVHPQSTPSLGRSVCVAYKKKTTAGAENPGVFTNTYSPATYGVSHTLALRPKYPSA